MTTGPGIAGTAPAWQVGADGLVPAAPGEGPGLKRLLLGGTANAAAPAAGGHPFCGDTAFPGLPDLRADASVAAQMLGRTGVVEAGIRVFWVLQGCPSRAGTWAGSALSVPLLEWHPAQLSVGSRQFAITVDHAG